MIVVFVLKNKGGITLEVLEFYYIKTPYTNYLKKYQNYIWNNEDKGNTRPYIGVLIEINNLKFYAPLTSPKTTNKNVKDNLMKIRIDHGDQFMGLINLNNILLCSIYYYVI